MKEYPFYIRSTVILLGLSLLVLALVTLRPIMVPLCLALVLAILLNPLINRLEKWRIPKIWAIILSLTASLGLIAITGYFVITQLGSFSDQLPVIKKQLATEFAAIRQHIAHALNIDVKQQQVLIQKAQSNIEPMTGHVLGTALGSLAMIFLLPVYTFLFLFYKTLILNFLFEVFDREKSAAVAEILAETKSAIQSYMIGLLLEALIIAILNSAVLLLFGVKYAILIGVAGALLNMLPYIGGIIAILMPVLMVTVTKGGYEAQLGIIAAYLVIQFIDNHFIVPYIVSSKVRINALISIIAVFLGGAAWGLSGMFLSIPFIGVLKIIFDRVPELKPWGKLLGDQVPTRHKGQIWHSKRKRTVSEKITGDSKP